MHGINSLLILLSSPDEIFNALYNPGHCPSEGSMGLTGSLCAYMTFLEIVSFGDKSEMELDLTRSLNAVQTWQVHHGTPELIRTSQRITWDLKISPPVQLLARWEDGSAYDVRALLYKNHLFTEFNRSKLSKINKSCSLIHTAQWKSVTSKNHINPLFGMVVKARNMNLFSAIHLSVKCTTLSVDWRKSVLFRRWDSEYLPSFGSLFCELEAESSSIHATDPIACDLPSMTFGQVWSCLD